jgi:hypothetical protein
MANRRSGRNQMSGPRSFDISKHLVFEAYLRVKANKSVDGESIEQFEVDLKATSTGCGIGCRRAATSRRRYGWWRSRSLDDVGSGCLEDYSRALKSI